MRTRNLRQEISNWTKRRFLKMDATTATTTTTTSVAPKSTSTPSTTATASLLPSISLKSSTSSSSSSLTADKILLSSVENYEDDLGWSRNGYQNMEEIRRLGKLCDITLIAQDHKFSAHRIVLAASIPYFNAMFLHDLLESKQDVIVLNNVDPVALEHVINYSYNGKITINNENVQSLLIAANFFHLRSIKHACCEFVKKRLCVQDALCLRSFAEQLMCHDLVVSVNRFINNNFSKIGILFFCKSNNNKNKIYFVSIFNKCFFKYK